MSNPICPNCGKDASNSPPMVPKGCEGWCLKCIQERPNELGKKCSKCKGDLHLKKNDNEISWCYHLSDKKFCENCWKQEEKNYRNHKWWGYGLIFMEKPINGGTAGNRIAYNWNTQKWEEKDGVEGNNNPSSEVIEEEKKKTRQYLKDKGIQKVKHSGSFLTGLNIEYTDGRKENNYSVDTPELIWISCYFSYLAEERGIKDNEKELSKLFFGQEIDSSNDNPHRERERERESNYELGLLN